ncbi:hypothetical protein RAB80_014499 [Fusarium oxysporum f. sp. vasinfectum]|nr:hypothetical protein RAB80_014490 [Fusarium oxysporum f. sp. vasinfectum]KAK2670358.1 hypothetical protein RAB80_014495 [Fusarium oxysporum f. sp. vasinfectum]KAK2670361.1 hypothetical protein RAB80_014498 [Fusarium oxysporum f. sp. vasinfectum]KAK2670362.1 hypothetical protein RAB80_014499 [Fusarium oxysporum f. sp. vasinfectum]
MSLSQCDPIAVNITIVAIADHAAKNDPGSRAEITSSPSQYSESIQVPTMHDSLVRPVQPLHRPYSDACCMLSQQYCATALLE